MNLFTLVAVPRFKPQAKSGMFAARCRFSKTIWRGKTAIPIGSPIPAVCFVPTRGVGPQHFCYFRTLSYNEMAAEPPAKRKCIGVNCENEAGSLQCPTCLKLGLKESFFCSQDCFKRSWVCFFEPDMPFFPALCFLGKPKANLSYRASTRAYTRPKAIFLAVS